MSFEGGSAVSSTLITFLLGLGIVFIGLIALIVIIRIMGAIMRAAGKKKPESAQEPAAQVTRTEPEGDLGEIKAAVAAALATMLGDSVKGIRIVSFKKLD
ncbi:MAG: OadG family protein [Clostridia bacterium]|nr:OadG family protein [Clostridia bacterium]